MSLADDLRAAKALIDTPKKWLKGRFSAGQCYCALGAIEAATGCYVYTLRTDLTDILVAAFPDPLPVGVDQNIDWNNDRDRARMVHRFNDHPDTTHADVMALFDRAIAAAEAAPAST